MFAPEIGYDVPPIRDHDARIKIWIGAHLPKGHAATVGSLYDTYTVMVDGDGPLHMLRVTEPLTHHDAAAATALLRAEDPATDAALATRLKRWAEADAVRMSPPIGATLALVNGNYLLPTL